MKVSTKQGKYFRGGKVQNLSSSDSVYLHLFCLGYFGIELFILSMK